MIPFNIIYKPCYFVLNSKEYIDIIFAKECIAYLYPLYHKAMIALVAHKMKWHKRILMIYGPCINVYERWVAAATDSRWCSCSSTYHNAGYCNIRKLNLWYIKTQSIVFIVRVLLIQNSWIKRTLHHKSLLTNSV